MRSHKTPAGNSDDTKIPIHNSTNTGEIQSTDKEDREEYLGGAHSGFERGEAVVEGAEDGDHAVSVGAALVERVAEKGHPLP